MSSQSHFFTNERDFFGTTDRHQWYPYLIEEEGFRKRWGDLIPEPIEVFERESKPANIFVKEEKVSEIWNKENKPGETFTKEQKPEGGWIRE